MASDWPMQQFFSRVIGSANIVASAKFQVVNFTWGDHLISGWQGEHIERIKCLVDVVFTTNL